MIPSVLMNLPGDVSRATSDVTLQAFIAEEEMIQEYVGEQVLSQILEPEIRRHFSDKYPTGDFPGMKCVFAPVLEEDRNKKFDRIVKGVGGHPFMTINEARSDVGKPAMAGPLDEPDKYDKIPEQIAAPATSFGAAPSKNPEESEATKTGAGEEEKQKLDKGNVEARRLRETVDRLLVR